MRRRVGGELDLAYHLGVRDRYWHGIDMAVLAWLIAALVVLFGCGSEHHVPAPTPTRPASPTVNMTPLATYTPCAVCLPSCARCNTPTPSAKPTAATAKPTATYTVALHRPPLGVQQVF